MNAGEKTMKTSMFLLALAVSMLSLTPAALAAEVPGWEEVDGPYVLIYSGKGAAEGGPEAIADVAASLGYEAAFIEKVKDLPKALKKAQAFAIGGTDDDTAELLFALAKVEGELRAYIQAGGRYLGICGGAYLASTGSDWPESEGGREDDLGLVPVESFAFDLANPDPQIITVQWPKGSPRTIYYQFGPAFDPKAVGKLSPAAEVLAYYSTGSVAAFSVKSGKGRIVLCGPHPEGVEDWLEDDDGSMILNHEAWNGKGTADLARELFAKLFAGG